jgi:hypothetical protein
MTPLILFVTEHYYFMTFIFISLLLLTDAMLCKNQLIGNLQPKMLASN